MLLPGYKDLKRALSRIGPTILVYASAIFVGVAGSDVAAAGWVQAVVPVAAGKVQAVAIAPSRPNRLYITVEGLGIARSDDRGETWTPANATLPLESDFHTLAVSPDDPDHLYAASSGDPTPGLCQVHRSVDGGQSWSRVGLPFDVSSILDLLIQSNDPDVILAATGGGSSPGIYRSVDGGDNWVLANGELSTVWDLAAHPTNSNILLAATNPGWARSTDGGATWTPGPLAAASKDLSWSVSDPDVVIAATNSALGLALSEDGGASFTPLASPAVRVHQVAIDPTDENVIFLAGYRDCESGASHVWKSEDRGDSWIEIWSPCLWQANELLIDPSAPANLYIGLQSPEGFWRSTDSGDSWSLKLDGVSSYGSWFVRTDSAGGVYSASRSHHLYTSDPAGPWSEMSIPFTIADMDVFEVNPSVPGMILESGLGGVEGSTNVDYAISSQNYGGDWAPELKEGFPPGLTEEPILFALDHASESVIYAFGYDTVFRSEDAHASYLEISTGPRIRAAVIDPNNPKRLFAGQISTPPVLLSEDGGATWAERSSGLPNAHALELFMDPANADRLVVVLTGTGAYQTRDGGLNWTPYLLTPRSPRAVAWDPQRNHIYMVSSPLGVITNDPRVLADGLPTRGPVAIAFSAVHQTVIIGTLNSGVYYQELSVPASVEPIHREAAINLSLRPNPSPGGTSIEIVLNAAAHATAVVRDVSGRLVAVLQDRGFEAGSHRVEWDGRALNGENAPSGVYFVQVTTDSAVGTERLIVIH